MDNVYSFFGKYTQEAVIEKEYPLQKAGMLTVNNIDGNITITSDWNKDSICLKATKRGAKDENIDLISVQSYQQVAQDGSQHLVLSTDSSNKEIKALVDYQLIVPGHIQVNLNTQNGDITVNNLKGTVHAKTVNGHVTINNTASTIIALSEEKGNITVNQAQGNVQATANKGNIKIVDATKSVIATTQKGNIETVCKEVLSTSRIVLDAQNSGGIQLAMPSTVNATIYGKTERGRFDSEHYITLKPITMQLNKRTRRDLLERQVNGLIGTGETDIRLSCNNGNINIVEVA